VARLLDVVQQGDVDLVALGCDLGNEQVIKRVIFEAKVFKNDLVVRLCRTCC